MKTRHVLIIAAVTTLAGVMLCPGQDVATRASRLPVDVSWKQQDRGQQWQWRDDPAVHIHISLNSWVRDGTTVQEIIRSAPAEVLSDQQKAALLAHSDKIGVAATGDQGSDRYNLFGPTIVSLSVDHQDQADQLARGFLGAYESWMAKEATAFGHKQLEAAKAKLAEAKATVEKRREEREKDLSLLGLPSGFECWRAEEVLPKPVELRAKKFMLLADSAGIKARLAAARKLATSAPANYKAQVDMLIATAELDLGDVQTRLDTMDAMIQAITRLNPDVLEAAETMRKIAEFTVAEWDKAIASGFRSQNQSYKVEIYTPEAAATTAPAPEAGGSSGGLAMPARYGQ